MFKSPVIAYSVGAFKECFCEKGCQDLTRSSLLKTVEENDLLPVGKAVTHRGLGSFQSRAEMPLHQGK